MQGKTIIITGAAGEIGFATAKLFVEAGANVMLVDINEDALQQKAKALNNSERVGYQKADVTRAEDVQAYVKATTDRFGGIDLFFNNAGIEGDVMPIHKMDMENFDQVMQVNVYGVVLGMKYVMPAMNDGGSIVITSSVAGLQGTPGMLPYITSKHATIGIMRTAALEGAERGIRVNTVHPGVIDSRMMESLEAGLGEDAKAVRKSFEQQVPLGRYGQEQEVAQTVFFLLSDKAAYTTGSTYVLDGGLLV
ncbi:MAG: SDR family NAD(P)-dependent oxidoreductase [Bacteroidota bacterium]